MSFFPSESEQIEMIDMAESAIAPAYSFAQNEIDEVLFLYSLPDLCTDTNLVAVCK